MQESAHTCPLRVIKINRSDDAVSRSLIVWRRCMASTHPSGGAGIIPLKRRCSAFGVPFATAAPISVLTMHLSGDFVHLPSAIPPPHANQPPAHHLPTTLGGRTYLGAATVGAPILHAANAKMRSLMPQSRCNQLAKDVWLAGAIFISWT